MLLSISTAFGVLLACGAPVAIALGVAGAGYIVFVEQMNPTVLVRRMYFAFDSFPLLSIPLFIMMGHLADRCGMIPNLVRWLQLVFGWLRGGRAYISIVGEMMFSGISGTAVGDIATLGRIEIKMLKEAGYPVAYSAALVATCSVLGPIIPPSVAMVIYALAVGNVSIGGLFMAGFGPGLALGLGLIGMSWYKARTGKYGTVTPFPTLSELIPETIRLLPLIGLPIVIIGGIVSGIMTVTESAAIGVAYTLIVGFVLTRTLRLVDIYDAVLSSALISSVLGLLMASGAIVSWIFTINRTTQQLADFLVSLTADPTLFMVFVTIALILLGMVMDSTAIIVALAPLLAPVARLYGIDDLQFGIVFVVSCMVGLITPPVGICLAMTANIANISFEAISREIWPFVVCCLFVVALCIIFPGLSLWLPRAVGF